MGNVYKRQNSWYIDLYVKGRRIRKKIGRSKRIAELALKDAEVKAAKDEYGFANKDISLDKFFVLFEDYSRANHQPKTTSRYKAVVDHFKSFLTTDLFCALICICSSGNSASEAHFRYLPTTYLMGHLYR